MENNQAFDLTRANLSLDTIFCPDMWECNCEELNGNSLHYMHEKYCPECLALRDFQPEARSEVVSRYVK